METKKKFSVCFAFAVLFAISSYAQGLKITEIKETVSGSDAFHAPIDKNGHPCGLVKIQAMIPDLRFEGEVEGDISFEKNEYKVFLAKGSKQLMIKRPQVLPVVVNFPDFGIGEISSKATYNIKLKEVSLNALKNLLVIDVMPRKANVYIDDLLIDNENEDGGYRLLLPKGEHLCKIEYRGYRSYASVVKIGKGTQTINAELESLLADVEIVCQTSGAHIIVDGQEAGIGSWKGKLPAGSYKVDVQLEGYISSSQTLVLDEKDNRTVSIPQLKRAKGSLSVITNVKGANVYLDGQLISNPKDIKDIQTGNHVLAVKAPFGYKEVERNFSISSSDNNCIKIEMVPIDDLYAKAFAGDVNAQAEICQMKMNSCKYQDRDTIERNYWYDRLYANIDKINKNVLEKVWIYYGPSERQIEGIYEYFEKDHTKSIKFLHKAIKFGYMEYGELAHHYFELGKYEEAILYWTKDINYPEYEFYFSDELTEACFKLKDINKGIAIINGAIEKDWDDAAKGVAYEGIGDIYSKIHNNPQAVQYYKKSLQLWLKLKGMNYDWVDDNIKRMKDKIRQYGN